MDRLSSEVETTLRSDYKKIEFCIPEEKGETMETVQTNYCSLEGRLYPQGHEL